MNQSDIPTKSTVFQQAGLSPLRINYWNELQIQFNKGDFTFIEYESKLRDEDIWKCHLELKSSRSTYQFNNKTEFDGDSLNQKLAHQFTDEESYSNAYWETFLEDIKWSGFFVPVDEFTTFTPLQLLAELKHLRLFSIYFNSSDYLNSIKKNSISSSFKGLPLTLSGIWNYFIYYNEFLHSCFENDSIYEKPLTHWHTRNVKLINFKEYLPSRQLSILLIITLEIGYKSGSRMRYLNRILNQSHSSVQSFFEKYEKDVSGWISEREGSLFSEEMKIDFIDCCKVDVSIITVLEMLNLEEKGAINTSFLQNLNETVLVIPSKNIITNIKRSLSKLSILDILWFDPLNYSVKPKRYIPKLKKFSYPSELKWYNIRESFLDNLQDIVGALPEKEKAELQATVTNRWSLHLMNVANILSAPAFIWESVQNKIVPQFNIFSNKEFRKHLETFLKKQESLADQKRRYKELVSELEKIKSIPEIQNFISDVAPFFDHSLRSQWQLKVNQHTKTIRGFEEYRERRMLEFGIIVEGENINYEKRIYLDEMLEIEKEIKKYIPFVKRAFKAALPIRKTIEFNDLRHDKSGIEFDPETINDQNKWLRGEVMKTLKSTITHDEIEQINTFCLDFSGSMKHARMRNLFKIMYLLVLGLEDRKSYDAFHFFNSNFIEGSNFSGEFTGRNILFNILSKISQIKNGAVNYGGYMGTNISGAILECHQRIQIFKHKIASKKLDSKFLCSMFVITDGEPNVGIINRDELNDFIQEKREEGEVAIKGIYIKSEEDENNFMEAIFGKGEFVETIKFDEAVNKFTAIMTKTYKDQRQSQKWEAKRKILKGNN